MDEVTTNGQPIVANDHDGDGHVRERIVDCMAAALIRYLVREVAAEGKKEGTDE